MAMLLKPAGSRQDVPMTSLVSYLLVDPLRYRIKGMNDAAWYLSERGGRTGGAKGIFLAQYGYRAVVVNDYDALKALLMGNVNVNEVPGEMVDGVDTGLVSAWQVLEREAAIGPCPIDLEYFKTTRPPLNYMNLSEHKQTKEFLFNGGYLSDFTNSQSVSGVSEAFQNHFLGLIEFPNNPSVEYHIANFINNMLRYLLANSPSLDLFEYLVSRVERSATACPGEIRTAGSILADRDALSQLKTRVAEHFKASLLQDVDKLPSSSVGVDQQVIDMIVQMVYIFTHHISKPLTAVLTNVFARFYMDPVLKSQIADEVKTATKEMDPGQNSFWLALSNSTGEKPRSLRAAFTNEILRVHPPQELVYMRAKQTFVVLASDGFNYKVNKGDRIIGNIRAAQRSNAVFGVPQSRHAFHSPQCDEFDISRFTDATSNTQLADKLLYLGGHPTLEDGIFNTHICPASGFITSVITLYSSMLSVCRFRLKTRPYWSGLRAGGLPDIAPALTTFEYVDVTRALDQEG